MSRGAWRHTPALLWARATLSGGLPLHSAAAPVLFPWVTHLTAKEQSGVQSSQEPSPLQTSTQAPGPILCHRTVGTEGSTCALRRHRSLRALQGPLRPRPVPSWVCFLEGGCIRATGSEGAPKGVPSSTEAHRRSSQSGWTLGRGALLWSPGTRASASLQSNGREQEAAVLPGA